MAPLFIIYICKRTLPTYRRLELTYVVATIIFEKKGNLPPPQKRNPGIVLN